MDIPHGKSNVMHAFTFAFNEFRDHPVRVQGLHQFDLGLTGAKEGSTHMLGRNVLSFVANRMEDFFPNGDCDIQVFHRDADVFNAIETIIVCLFPARVFRGIFRLMHKTF